MKIPGPTHPISIEDNPSRVVVRVSGKVIADTRDALTLREADYPAVVYIPRRDVDMTALTRSEHTTYCPYKGDASYYSIPAGGDRSVNAVWTYERPFEAMTQIGEYLAFYHDRVDEMTTGTLGGHFTFPGTSLTVQRIGYGAMQLAGPGVWGPPKDPDAAVAILHEAVSAGVNHIDTADYYGPHITNQIIRQALYPYPAGLVIVTKLGGRRPPDRSWQTANSSQELTAGVHDNLLNLGLETLDIVNYRVMGSGNGPGEGSIAEQVGVLAELRREGLIRHIGLSNVTSAQVAEARSITEIVCVQNNYNLANRHDDPLIEDLARQGIAYVPFFPLGGFTPLHSSTLSSLAGRIGSTPMQVALAWLLHRSPNILLIPGTSSVAHLRENLAAGQLTLSPQTLAELDEIAGSDAMT
jgi:pyridoxine 4-dehydrogenase